MKLFIFSLVLSLAQSTSVSLRAQEYFSVCSSKVITSNPTVFNILVTSNYGNVEVCIYRYDSSICDYYSIATRISETKTISTFPENRYCARIKNINFLYSTVVEYIINYSEPGQDPDDFGNDSSSKGLSNVVVLFLILCTCIPVLIIVIGIFVYKKCCHVEVKPVQFVEERPGILPLPPHIQFV